MFRSFAVVPAAGLSIRMGAAKLLLPVGGRPIIDRVLAAWSASSVTRTVAVVRRDDEALIACCRKWSAVDVVAAPSPPPDMKASVWLGLDYIRQRYAPSNRDAWLVAPADLPCLSPQVVNQVLLGYDPEAPTAVVPVFRGKPGHPVLAPWAHAQDVASLGSEQGIDALLSGVAIREVACDVAAPEDVDTPDDYAAAARRWVDGAAGDETAAAQPGL